MESNQTTPPTIHTVCLHRSSPKKIFNALRRLYPDRTANPFQTEILGLAEPALNTAAIAEALFVFLQVSIPWREGNGAWVPLPITKLQRGRHDWRFETAAPSNQQQLMRELTDAGLAFHSSMEQLTQHGYLTTVEMKTDDAFVQTGYAPTQKLIDFYRNYTIGQLKAHGLAPSAITNVLHSNPADSRGR